MAAGLVFLTPAGVLLALGALIPLAGVFLARRRASRVRGVLGVSEPRLRTVLVALVAVVAAGVFLGVAAAQPVVERTLSTRTRTDAEAFFVLDVSRSMLARTDPESPSRIERAKQAAITLRSAFPEIPFGIASMTDRVLPHLFPSVDEDVFDATLQRSVDIERPPPRSNLFTSATRLDSLATIRTQRFFTPRARKRLVVVLTDGESQPVSTARLRNLFLQQPRIEVVFLQFWGRDEHVYTGRAAEPAYRPDPSARSVLGELAKAMGGSVYGEHELSAARGDVRKRLGSGPSVVRGEQGSRIPLAPYFAAAALVPLFVVLRRRDR
jgi:hypothetical protein